MDGHPRKSTLLLLTTHNHTMTPKSQKEDAKKRTGVVPVGRAVPQRRKVGLHFRDGPGVGDGAEREEDEAVEELF